MGQAAQAIEPAIDRPDAASVDIHLRVLIATSAQAELVEGEVVSIAPGGMRVRASVPAASALTSGDTVTLRFRMLAQRVCEARGRVLWLRDDTFAVAIEERNPGMDSFLQEIAKLPTSLRQIYLADVLHPRVEISA